MSESVRPYSVILVRRKGIKQLHFELCPGYRPSSRPISRDKPSTASWFLYERPDYKSDIPKMDISKCLAISSLAFLPFIITYLTTLLQVVTTFKKGKPRGSPPTVPYWIPWIGHAWSFVLSPTRLAQSVRYDFTIFWHWLY